MDREDTYVVKTRWGTFRLDARAYRDYLQGRSWIGWVPGRKDAGPAVDGVSPELPPEVTEAAIKLRGDASAGDPSDLLLRRFPLAGLTAPFRERMRSLSIDEMPLSCRSSNGLKRAGACDFGKLYDILKLDPGLKAVRNIGAKSEAEILRCFFNACYERLTETEKSLCWQELLNGRGEN